MMHFISRALLQVPITFTKCHIDLVMMPLFFFFNADFQLDMV